MRLIPWILQLSRLFLALTLIAGPTCPAYAGLVGAPSHVKGSPVPKSVASSTAKRAQIQSSSRLTGGMYFEANRGQADASVKFLTRAGGYNLYLTASEAVMVMPRPDSIKSNASGVVRMKLKGSNARASVRGLGILPGYTNYLLGNDSAKWLNGVKHYSKVKFAQVYPGIDMVYRFDGANVEYDFVVAPGANPGRILLSFEGGKNLRLDDKGNLIHRVEGGELTYNAPNLYQTLGSKRIPVKGRFVLASNNHVRFEVGNYIKNKELVIDPTLAYSSFLGGTVEDRAYAIAVDASNNAYLTGKTASVNFATGNAVGAGQLQPAYGTGAYDVFVTKIDPAGALLWSTYYGAAGSDIGLGIAVDGAGKIYVSGSTTGTLPVTVPPYTQIGAGGGTDAFVAAFKADGTGPLIYANQIGGPGEESANGIAVDTAGNAYITGYTDSAGFVVMGAAQGAIGGMTDAFVAKFSAAGAPAYSTFLGGTNADLGNAIAIDTLGNAYVTGKCQDAFVSVVGYPTVFKNTVTGSDDAFIAKLDPTGATFLYKTYVGGAGIDEGTAIALDSSNNIYITGSTFSADFPGASFVTVGQTTIGTAPDAFVFKLNVAGGGGILDGVYSTFLGASGSDVGTAIAVDASNNAYVTGRTFSGDFPMVGPITGGGSLVGSAEAFVTQVGPTGGTFGFSTYLGGTTDTGGQGIALDSLKNIYVSGWTSSTDYPTVVTPFQAALSGPFDAFVTKIGTPAPPAACTITSIDPASGFRIGGTVVTINITNFTGFLGTGVTFDGAAASTYTANASSTVITATAPRHPLAGPLTAGLVPLVVKTHAGTCSANYTYVSAPTTDNGACGDDFFFPSPATGATAQFAYCMALPGTVRIRIYNVVGDLAAKIVESKEAGAQLSQLNTARLAPGVYLYRLEKDYGGANSTTSKVKKFVVKH